MKKFSLYNDVSKKNNNFKSYLKDLHMIGNNSSVRPIVIYVNLNAFYLEPIRDLIRFNKDL